MNQDKLLMIASKDELLKSIQEDFFEVEKFFISLSSETFTERKSGWSSEENFRHLIKSNSAILIGLMTPKFLLRIFFGSDALQKKFPELIHEYQSQLGKGKGAGIYAPRKLNRDKFSLQKVQNQWRKLGNRFQKTLQNWDETDLKKLRLPHPILGNISVWNMLLFMLYHSSHHIEKLRDKLKGI